MLWIAQQSRQQKYVFDHIIYRFIIRLILKKEYLPHIEIFEIIVTMMPSLKLLKVEKY